MMKNHEYQLLRWSFVVKLYLFQSIEKMKMGASTHPTKELQILTRFYVDFFDVKANTYTDSFRTLMSLGMEISILNVA